MLGLHCIMLSSNVLKMCSWVDRPCQPSPLSKASTPQQFSVWKGSGLTKASPGKKLHGCWYPVECAGNPPIWLSLQNFQRSVLLPIQIAPSSTVDLVEVPVAFRDTVLSPFLERVNPLSMSKKILVSSKINTQCWLHWAWESGLLV